MPTNRQRAIIASAETKALLPEVPQRSATIPTSYFYPYTEPLPPLPPNLRQRALRTAVIEDLEPLDVAIHWQNYSFSKDDPTSAFPFGGGDYVSSTSAPCGHRAPPVHFRTIIDGGQTNRVLVLNTANEKKAGGEWDGGILTLEEGFARRSNLVQALNCTDPRTPAVQTYYPLPQTGAVYSPSVVVFREGFKGGYTIWGDDEWKVVSVVSAPPVRRPKTDETGMKYSFDEEKNLQRDKMKSVLRVAALNGHTNLVLGGFGSCGPEGSGSGVYRNPVRDVCLLWKELLESEEFVGWFANIVFALAGDSGGSWATEDKDCAKEFNAFFGPG